MFLISGTNDERKTPLEIKQPTGNGKQTISHQFEDAAGQARIIAIDADGLGDYWTKEKVMAEVQQKLNREHTIRKGKKKGEEWSFINAIVTLNSETFSIARREG